MSKSKNDFPLAGGTARLTFHPHRGQYDAIYTLIDPQTHCPYTYGRLAEDLTQRKQDYPYLAELIDDSKYNSIMAKAADQPETVFSLSISKAKRKRRPEHSSKKNNFLSCARWQGCCINLCTNLT